MRHSALTLALAGAISFVVPLASAHATIETPEAKMAAADAAQLARDDMFNTFGRDSLKTGEHLWKQGNTAKQVTRVVISLSDQLAFAYNADELIAVSTISSGTDKHPTPTGIFPILDKKRFHRSFKYENAPMPYMQRLDSYGIALHAGHLPGHRASHGCVRLPASFASKLFAATQVGTEVLIGEEPVNLADAG